MARKRSHGQFGLSWNFTLKISPSTMFQDGDPIHIKFSHQHLYGGLHRPWRGIWFVRDSFVKNLSQNVDLQGQGPQHGPPHGQWSLTRTVWGSYGVCLVLKLHIYANTLHTMLSATSRPFTRPMVSHTAGGGSRKASAWLKPFWNQIPITIKVIQSSGTYNLRDVEA